MCPHLADQPGFHDNLQPKVNPRLTSFLSNPSGTIHTVGYFAESSKYEEGRSPIEMDFIIKCTSGGIIAINISCLSDLKYTT
jgi:hypothetical protein